MLSTDLTYHENYWDSPAQKQQFMIFMMQIFRLDLSFWDEAGYWDDLYRPFSFFDGDELVANVCVYTMNMCVNGKQCTVAQFSAVGTRPEYRRRGLGQSLMQKAADWAREKHDFFFLFSDTDGSRLYERCGFRPTKEYRPRIPALDAKRTNGMICLNMLMSDHRELVFRHARSRVPVSNVLGVMNERLFMFWCLTYLRDTIHFIKDLDTLVLFSRQNGLLTIHDIVGPAIPQFSALYPYICQDDDKCIEFEFMTDRLALENVECIEVTGNGTHLKGNFPLEGTHFLFPLTAHA